MTDDLTSEPLLQVVRGEPNPEELAALVAVLGGRAAAGTDRAPATSQSAWNDPARLVRRPVAPGPGQWVGSGRPV